MYWYSTRKLSDLVTRDYIHFPSDGFDDYIARSMWLALPQSRRSSSFALGIQVSMFCPHQALEDLILVVAFCVWRAVSVVFFVR